MAVPQNFKCIEFQPLSVTNASANVQFTKAESSAAPDCFVENYGTKGCSIVFGAAKTAPTAVQIGSAAGTTQIYIAAGLAITLKKDAATFVAAITEGSDTTSLALHAGYGGVT